MEKNQGGKPRRGEVVVVESQFRRGSEGVPKGKTILEGRGWGRNTVVGNGVVLDGASWWLNPTVFDPPTSTPRTPTLVLDSSFTPFPPSPMMSLPPPLLPTPLPSLHSPPPSPPFIPHPPLHLPPSLLSKRSLAHPALSERRGCVCVLGSNEYFHSKDRVCWTISPSGGLPR